MKKTILLFSLALVFWQCGNQNQKIENPLEGEINVTADESLQPIVDAQIMAYNAHYPLAKINIKYVPEQKAMNIMMSDSADVAIVTREFTENEMKVFAERKINYLPAKMALDGVALISNLESPIKKISFAELKAMFEGKTKTDIKLVFDNSSSSNLNVMMEKLGIKDLSKANIFAAEGNKDAIEYIKKNKNAIGIIGNNWLSDTYDRQAKAFVASVNILEVSKDGIEYFRPDFSNLKSRKYPLERKIIMHTKQHFGLSKGFIRFCCAQVGQLVVEKAGLLPYYKYSKEIVVDKSMMEGL